MYQNTICMYKHPLLNKFWSKKLIENDVVSTYLSFIYFYKTSIIRQKRLRVDFSINTDHEAKLPDQQNTIF